MVPLRSVRLRRPEPAPQSLSLEPHHAWQIERIQDGAAAAREARVRPAEDVFSGIAAKHGWPR